MLTTCRADRDITKIVREKYKNINDVRSVSGPCGHPKNRLKKNMNMKIGPSRVQPVYI